MSDLTYSYKQGSTDTGMRQSVADHLTGQTTTYTYNNRSWLTEANTSNGGPDYTWSYDADGNITGGNAVGPHSYNAVDQLAGGSYDADGNLTNANGAAPDQGVFAYNGADQTTSITPTGGSAFSMTYGQTGQAERSAAGGTGYTNGALGVMSQTGASGSTGYYERGSDGTLISKIDSGGDEYYYVTDGIGSVIAMIDTGSDTVATYSYDPYGGHGVIGHPDAPDNTVGEANPYRYAGGYRDAATGLVKFGDRYYDPHLARWTQIDPINHLLNLKEGNPYSYAGDQPTNATDPAGSSFLNVGGTFHIGPVQFGAGIESGDGGSHPYGSVGVNASAEDVEPVGASPTLSVSQGSVSKGDSVSTSECAVYVCANQDLAGEGSSASADLASKGTASASLTYQHTF